MPGRFRLRRTIVLTSNPVATRSTSATATWLETSTPRNRPCSIPAAAVAPLMPGLGTRRDTVHDGRTVKILSALEGDARGEGEGAAGAPGELVDVARAGTSVACGTGALLLGTVQPEGGRPMSSWEYAQGRRVRKGDRLSR